MVLPPPPPLELTLLLALLLQHKRDFQHFLFIFPFSFPRCHYKSDTKDLHILLMLFLEEKLGVRECRASGVCVCVCVFQGKFSTMIVLLK